MLEDLLDSASVGGRRAMTALQKAAEFFDGDDDRGILLEGLVGIAAGLVDAINGVTVPDESCGPRCNCGSCDDTGSEHGLVEHRGWNTCPDLCGCATHGGQYAGTQRAEHGLVLPSGNTPAESCAEASECDRSVTPSREPLLAARDEARRAALDAYKDATPEQMVAMLAGVSVEDVRRLGGVPDGRFGERTLKAGDSVPPCGRDLGEYGSCILFPGHAGWCTPTMLDADGEWTDTPREDGLEASTKTPCPDCGHFQGAHLTGEGCNRRNCDCPRTYNTPAKDGNE